MILKRLVEFAERLSDLPVSGYQPRFVTKVIRIRGNGSLIDVVDLAGETRGKRTGMTVILPQEAPRRGSAIVPRLIADNANYALGRSREEDDPAKVMERHSAYRRLVSDCADATGETSVIAIRDWLESGGASSLREHPSIAEDDELLFEVDGVRPTDLPSVRRFWTARSKTVAEGTCLVTGNRGPVVDRMPAPIKGVPQGQMSGTALISVNNPAGESYGLSAALNSPISAYAAESICNGLNYLLASSIHSLRVGKAVYVFWTREPEAAFSWDILHDPKPEHVAALLESAKKAHRSSVDGKYAAESADFFIMALSANASRIVVRDYHETTLEHVRANLIRWFKRLEIVSPDGSEPKPGGIFRLAASLYRDAKDMPAHVPTALLSSAITGSPLPDFILGLAAKRNLAMQGPFTEYKNRRSLSVERLSLIKAVLSQREEHQTLMTLNTGHPSSAYHCGRLLSVLESIQRLAIPGLNATLVDRTYGAASGSPASVFGNLLKDATSAHLPKLRKSRPGAWIALDQRLQEVIAGVGDQFPKTLSLDEQGLFALGYYHQRANDFAEARRNRELKELASAEPAAASEADETGEEE